ncbi:hypothetical protein L208DRAFT_928310 [Tricholoma matsutake]|nr:hypothetical protein L208DRAFT_928310 [Tricholoma matsutake 945]
MGTSYLVFECSKEKRGPQPLFHYIYTCSQAPACEVYFTVPITYVVLTSPEPVWTSLVLDWWQPVQQL